MPRRDSRSRSRDRGRPEPSPRKDKGHRTDKGDRGEPTGTHERSRDRDKERAAPRVRDRSREREHEERPPRGHDRSQGRDRDRDRERDERPRARDERQDRGEERGQERRWRSRSRDAAGAADTTRRDSPGRGGRSSRHDQGYDERPGPEQGGHGGDWGAGGSGRGGQDGGWRGGGGGGRRGGGRGRGRRDDDRRPGGKEVWGRPDEEDEEGGRGGPPEPAVVVEPIMELSGKLAAETNKVGGTVLKYQPPVDAAKPDKKWRLYVFKGDKLAEDDPLYLHRNDCCLFGRDKNIVDVLCAHPSISKQHAVLQYRKTSKPDDFGLEQWSVRPYLMDLAAVNGTFLNGERIEAQRYYELLPKDVIKFGQSTRDYVLLHEELSKGM